MASIRTARNKQRSISLFLFCFANWKQTANTPFWSQKCHFRPEMAQFIGAMCVAHLKFVLLVLGVYSSSYSKSFLIESKANSAGFFFSHLPFITSTNLVSCVACRGNGAAPLHVKLLCFALFWLKIPYHRIQFVCQVSHDSSRTMSLKIWIYHEIMNYRSLLSNCHLKIPFKVIPSFVYSLRGAQWKYGTHTNKWHEQWSQPTSQPINENEWQTSKWMRFYCVVLSF